MGQTFQVAELDLASRLSFFLWGTGPDEELITAATSGTLQDPGRDRQAGAADAGRPALGGAGDPLRSQWLRLQDVEKIRPDALLYPNWDHTLAETLVRETELFFDSLVRDDRSILDLLRADYTFVNERVARHYGIPNVMGAEFRRVPTPAGRRGVLGQGSVLLLTSVADRTSPVQRGKWVMEVLLGSPPPAPPPNVPALEETGGAKGGTPAVDARAHGTAPREPGMQVVPQGDRSARPRARELRRHRRLAHQGQRSAGRRGRRPLRRHEDERPDRARATRC